MKEYAYFGVTFGKYSVGNWTARSTAFQIKVF